MRELLQMFCAKDIGPVDLTHPFSHEEYTYATNGYACVRVPRVDDIVRPIPLLSIIKLPLFPAPDDEGEWVEIPQLPGDIWTVCGDCGGHGKVISCEECKGSGYGTYIGIAGSWGISCPRCDGQGFIAPHPDGDQECEECDGVGKVLYRRDRNRLIGKTRVALHLLELASRCPGAMVFASTNDASKVIFRFDGGEGALMGLRPEMVGNDDGEAA